MAVKSRSRFFLFSSLFGLLLLFSIAQTLFAQETANSANLVTIEGPVQSIGGNAITISGINIQISPDDPVWADLQVGDVVRVQANSVEQDDDTVILVAVVVIIVTDVPTPEATPDATPDVTPDVTPEATPDPDDDDLPITIVIEGPVQAININIITIYNINIQVDADDPILTVIQIGDIVRIEGNIADDDDDSTTIVVVAVTIIIINIDVVIGDNVVWRDNGNCSNPPPPWAPANGWRRRCENRSPGGAGMGMGGTGGRGRGGSGS